MSTETDLEVLVAMFRRAGMVEDDEHGMGGLVHNRRSYTVKTNDQPWGSWKPADERIDPQTGAVTEVTVSDQGYSGFISIYYFGPEGNLLAVGSWE